MKRGLRIVHGDKELVEKLGRNDLCPCGSRRRFQGVLHRNRPVSSTAITRTLTMITNATAILYRPVGPAELELIRQSGFREFPPRLPEQPIFYPVLTEDYAVKIARDWNVPASGVGYVTRFAVKVSFLQAYQVQEAGGRAYREYWIPAEEPPAFNAAIVGPIEVIASFGRTEVEP